MSEAAGVPPNGEPFAPVIWVKVEMKGPRVSVAGNAPAHVLCNILKEGIVAMARQMERDEKATLVTPVTGPMPPLRRI